MKSMTLLFAACTAVVLSAQAQEVLEGDKRLACEATLCLLSGQRPDQCEPSLRRYFGIHYRKPSDTLKARRNFLETCPKSDENQVSAITMGAGNCEPETLNRMLRIANAGSDGSSTVISNHAPQYCFSYYALQGLNANTMPRYVGTPETGGYWASAAEY